MGARRDGRWLNSTVVGIGVASFCSDVGHEMATVALPALIASFGAASGTLGVIEGLADGLSSFAKLLSGHYSDRLPRRKALAVIGYFATAFGMASFAVATQTWHVLAGRVGGWLGRGVRTPVRKALLTEATTPQTYGRAFGLERSMDSAGAVVGPLAAAFILAHWGIRRVFALTLVPGVLAAVMIATLVQEKPHRPRSMGPLFASLRSFPIPFQRFLLGVGIAGLGDYSKTLLILWATEAWTPTMGRARAAALAMLFYVGYNIVQMFASGLSGRLSDACKKHQVLALGYLLAVVPAAALLLPGNSLVKFGAVFGFSGLYMGFWETVESTSAATLLPENIRGIGFGTLAGINGIGDMISSASVGILWALSPWTAMAWVAGTSIMGAGLILTSPPAKVRTEERN